MHFISRKMVQFFPCLCLLVSCPAFSQPDIAFTADQVAVGEVAYKETCQICHGNRLSNGQFGTPLRGGFFRNNWKGRTLGELLQHIWEKMPPDNVQSLDRELVAALTAFILSRNELEPGEFPMPADPALVADTPLPWQ